MRVVRETTLFEFCEKTAWSCDWQKNAIFCVNEAMEGGVYDFLEGCIEYFHDVTETAINDFLRFDAITLLVDMYFGGNHDKFDSFVDWYNDGCTMDEFDEYWMAEQE